MRKQTWVYFNIISIEVGLHDIRSSGKPTENLMFI